MIRYVCIYLTILSVVQSVILYHCMVEGLVTSDLESKWEEAVVAKVSVIW
jgi:hypothetical protein